MSTRRDSIAEALFYQVVVLSGMGVLILVAWLVLPPHWHAERYIPFLLVGLAFAGLRQEGRRWRWSYLLAGGLALALFLVGLVVLDGTMPRTWTVYPALSAALLITAPLSVLIAKRLAGDQEQPVGDGAAQAQAAGHDGGEPPLDDSPPGGRS